MIERYTRPFVGTVWSERNKFATWLEVETVVCEEMEGLGLCPKGTGRKIREKGKFVPERIRELELTLKHDVIAFITNVSESLGDESRFFHYGMTSSDLLDTSLALLSRTACLHIESGLSELREALRSLAVEHRHTVMVGRTHGMHAEPITFGLKLLVWFEEVGRNSERLKRARETISVGKLSGAVGAFSHLPPELEERVLRRLDLQPEPVATQIVQRDRHAELLTTLAITAGSLEKWATEIRHLQRTEVLEAEERFTEGQKGSSAMPHKRNPILCERVCGLARIVRGNALAAMENISLWHERDISHSSVERVIIPDSFILIDYMISVFTDIMRNLKIHPERMEENLSDSKDLIFSQRLLLELVQRGVRREEAYSLIQSIASEALDGHLSFRDGALRHEKLQSLLGRQALQRCFDISYLLRHVDYIYKRVLGE